MCLAVPGAVLDIWEKDGTKMAKVDFGGVEKEVCCEFVPDIGSATTRSCTSVSPCSDWTRSRPRRRWPTSNGWVSSRWSSATPGRARPRKPERPGCRCAARCQK